MIRSRTYNWLSYGKTNLFIRFKLIPMLLATGLIPIGIALYGLIIYLLER